MPQFGGIRRDDPVTRYALHHGDVVVWGVAIELSRRACVEAERFLTGPFRLSLTFHGALRI